MSGGVPAGWMLVPVEPTETMVDRARKAITDRYYAGGKVHQMTAVKPRDLAELVLRAALACEECKGSGYIRWRGRDNSEEVADCPSCTPTPPPSRDADVERVASDAADLLSQYADFIRSDVKADDFERHPYVPTIDDTIAALHALGERG